MLVTVTREHIEAGVHQNACACPVALAILAASGLPRVWVDSDKIRWDYPPECRTQTPRDVAAWIDRYDGGNPVEPFSFTLTLPESAK